MSIRRADSAHPPHRIPQLPGKMPDLDGASCLDHPYVSPDAWTGARESYRDRELARAVCLGCPVMERCREFGTGPVGAALNGILGGLSASERRQIRHDREVAR